MSARAWSSRLLGCCGLVLLTSACGGAPPPVPPPAPPPPAAAPPVPSVPADPLGPEPQPTLGAPFKPPAPAVYTTANGMQVWLLERHALPVLAITVVVPSGASSDPKGQAGLAEETAEMLREGAAARGALDFARAIDDLGASISSSSSMDASYVRLSVLKRGFAAGMQLLGDAVARPRMDAGEWRRLHDLWTNDLKARAADPGEVAACVERIALYGVDHPYGHPVDGFLTSAPKVQLADAKRFYAQAWRPDRAIVVVVGDVTRSELDAQLDASLGTWKAPAAPPLPIVTPPVPSSLGDGGKPRLVLVDRADAPQAQVYAAWPGVAASDPRYPALYRANIALGGGFTSRINLDLREKRGWTYGASSAIGAKRGLGVVSAGGAFVTPNAVDALKAMLADVDLLAKSGMTEAEVAKTRLQSRAEYVDDYERVEHAAAQLAHDAGLGLSPDYEATASVAADRADATELNQLLKTFFDRAPAAIVIVGPRAKLEGPLTQAGYGPIELMDAEGNPVPAKGTK